MRFMMREKEKRKREWKRWPHCIITPLQDLCRIINAKLNEIPNLPVTMLDATLARSYIPKYARKSIVYAQRKTNCHSPAPIILSTPKILYTLFHCLYTTPPSSAMSCDIREITLILLRVYVIAARVFITCYLTIIIINVSDT